MRSVYCISTNCRHNLIIITWLRGNHDHQSGSFKVKPYHCTKDRLATAINSNVVKLFWVVGSCVRAVPLFVCKTKVLKHTCWIYCGCSISMKHYNLITCLFLFINHNSKKKTFVLSKESLLTLVAHLLWSFKFGFRGNSFAFYAAALNNWPQGKKSFNMTCLNGRLTIYEIVKDLERG